MINKTTTYKSDISIGVKSENLILEFFKKNNLDFEDKRNNPEYRRMDIDFVWLINGMRYRVEVKTIQNINYINIETVYDVNNRHLLNDWLNSCQATYIFFVCSKENKFISLDYQKFKKWFMPLKSKHEELVNKTTIKGNKSHTSAFVKLPVNVIDKELYKIIEL